jgi:DNA-binding Lrp family transcriptional regulator
MKLDEKDRAIIRELEKDSKQTTHKLSKKLNYPVTTIYNRIKKLEKLGVILGYTLHLDWKKLGRPITAFIGVTIRRGTSHIITAKQIRGVEGVYELNTMTGGSDFLVKVRAKDIEDLNEIITSKFMAIDGIDRSQTAIVLNHTHLF